MPCQVAPDLFLGLITVYSSSVVYCPLLIPGKGESAASHPQELAGHLSATSSFVTPVSAPVILSQATNP